MILNQLEFPLKFKMEKMSGFRAQGRYEGMLMTIFYDLDPQQAIIPILLEYLGYYNIAPHEFFVIVYAMDEDEEYKPWMKTLEVTGICSIIVRKQLKYFSPCTWENQK